jgi:hypothetical protein
MAVDKENLNQINHTKSTNKSRGTTKKHQPRQSTMLDVISEGSEGLLEGAPPKRYRKKASMAVNTGYSVFVFDVG